MRLWATSVVELLFMTEIAHGYYRQRADLLGIEVPIVLDGLPRRVFGRGDANPIVLSVVKAVEHYLRPVEPFLIAGLPEVCYADDQHLSLSQWERIQDLPTEPRIHPIARHFARNVAPHLSANIPPTGQAYLEAIAPGDVSPAMWRRIRAQRSNPPRDNDEAAAAFFLSRTADENNNSIAATVTVGWARHFDGEHVPTVSGKPFRESLTVRYASATLLRREIAALPPL